MSASSRKRRADRSGVDRKAADRNSADRKPIAIGITVLAGIALCLAGAALAGPNAGGTVVLHNANLTYENTNECGRGSAPASCSEAVTEIDGSGPSSYKVFKVYAAFPEGSQPRLRGITFGISYTAPQGGQAGCSLVGYGPCAELELAMNGWPASDTGTSMVWDETQTAGLVECYWFAGYNYYGATTFSLIPHPQQDGYFADDGVPSVLDEIAGYGVLGFDQPGQLACPAPLVFGACCHPDGSCTTTLESACLPPNVWQGPLTVCSPNPCPQPMPGACCLGNGSCVLLSQYACTQQGGTWLGEGTTCDPNPCPPPVGACCHTDGSCTMVTEACCTGTWMGWQSDCTPNPCPQPTGACCVGAACTITVESACSGSWLGPNTDCDPNPCSCRSAGRQQILPPPPESAGTTAQVGPGGGVVPSGPRTNPCPDSNLLLNADGTYENGYSWQYGGNLPPYYGAFAEGYDATGTVCGIQLMFTTLEGYYSGQSLDAYVWDSADGDPNNVISLTTGLSITPPAIWPDISTHDLAISDGSVAGHFFVGFWGNWPDQLNGWFVAADLDGFGGLPRTNIAPGIGYPSCWQDPSIIWGPTQSLGIGAYVREGPPIIGACCHPDGACTLTTQGGCYLPDEWQGPDTACDPNPCTPIPYGACCQPDGSCTVTTQASCQYPNVWQGPDTLCQPNPCPAPMGACCLGSDCTVTTEAGCTGSWMGPNTDCDPNPCDCRSAGRRQILPPPPRSAGKTAQLGPHGSIVPSGPRTNPCPESTLYLTADGSYENGYSWQYGGNLPPYYGAFAEGYDATGTVCGIQLMLTTLEGNYTGQTLDAYVWDSADGNPNNVLSLTTGVSITPPAIWPQISTHDLAVSEAEVAGDFFVGFWGVWPEQLNGWWIAADLTGPFGTPRTYIAPGTGYPPCWQDPSIVWGGTQSLGIGAYVSQGPPIIGACCHPDGSCTLTSHAGCPAPNEWQGADTACDPNPCPQPVAGACCPGDGSCVILFEYLCVQQGGTWLGEGTTCEPNPCPPPVGACCHADGSCTMTTQACCTGTWLGWQSDCTPNPCPQPTGACCHPDGSCTVTTQANCQSPNEWQGPNTSCSPNPCTPQPYGACCHPDGLCTMTYQGQCVPPNQFVGGTCDPNPCAQPPIGACCRPDGTCVLTTQADCSYPNIWLGPDTPCEPNPCPIPTGACCIGTYCTVTTMAECDGWWMGPGTDCSPNPCADPCRSAGRRQIVPPPPKAAWATAQVGITGSVVPSRSRSNPCPGSTLYLNADGTYENGYAWQYGGSVPPYFGAFAEGYNASGNVCGMQLMLTTISGYYTGQTLDAYVWDSDGGNPNNVLSVTVGMAISPPALWPNISTHDIDISDAHISGDFFAGFWGNWPGVLCGWFVAADLDGFGGMPRTNIAPGIGYPSCWQDPSIVWGPTQALGVGAYLGSGGPVPVKVTTWGKIKNLYK